MSECCETIYLVWNPSENDLPVRYPNVEAARKGAQCLAQKYLDQEILMLRAVESVKCESSPFVYKSYSKSLFE